MNTERELLRSIHIYAKKLLVRVTDTNTLQVHSAKKLLVRVTDTNTLQVHSASTLQ